jgi:hypothetical protein
MPSNSSSLQVTPHMSPLPARFSSSTQHPRRNDGMIFSCSNRFIPNRSQFNTSQAHSSLLNCVNEQEENAVSESEYKRQLRRPFFGQEEKPSSLLGFGASKGGSSLSSSKNPFCQGILRSNGSPPSLKPTVKRPAVGLCAVKTKHEALFFSRPFEKTNP